MTQPIQPKERLERFLAYSGLASRREAKDLIKSGKVSVNGTIVTEPGYGIIPPKDKVSLTETTQKESHLLFKPRGIETSKTSPTGKDIHDRFKHLKHLSPIGRLDKDSDGLIILSNDGTLTKALTKIDSTVGKTYKVTVRENISDAALQKMATGIVLDKIKTKPAIVKRASRTSFEITLFEGRKHQIRRMCDACQLTIDTLTRTAIGPIKTGTLKSGNSRKLTQEEVASLKI
jgi:pseudouridine synthase